MNYEKKHFNYGIISGDTVTLYNESEMPVFPSSEDALVDVNAEFCENGLLKIDAKKIKYDYYSRFDGSRIFEEDWRNTPLPKEIKKGKRSFWSKKEESYVDCGWVKTTKTTQIQYILSKYKVKICL